MCPKAVIVRAVGSDQTNLRAVANVSDLRDGVSTSEQDKKKDDQRFHDKQPTVEIC
jgi:hypothetical protein